MKKYESPSAEVLYLSVGDIMQTSAIEGPVDIIGNFTVEGPMDTFGP